MCKESETSQETVSTVPKYIEDAGKNLVSKAEDLASKPYTPYTGDRVADFSGDQQSAFQQLRDMISGAPQVRDEALQGARDYASAPGQQVSTERIVDEDGRLGAIGDYFNPYVDQALQPALQKIMEAADAQRKRIGAGATSAGAFGDARHGILERDLDSNTSDAIGDTASNFFMNAFDKAMGHRTSDLNRFGQTDQANAGFNEAAIQRGLVGSGELVDRAAADQAQQLQQIQALLSSGGLQQGADQAGLDADFEEFLRQYGHDFSVLEALGAALSGVPYEQRQTTTGTSPDNSLMQLGGSAAGALLGTEAVGSAAAAAIPAMLAMI